MCSGTASGTPLGLAWKGLEAASAQGPKGLEALESRARARLLGDDWSSRGPREFSCKGRGVGQVGVKLKAGEGMF